MQATEHLSDLVGQRVCFAEPLGAQKTLEPRTWLLANCFPPKVA
jgi:hypothetical protein